MTPVAADCNSKQRRRPSVPTVAAVLACLLAAVASLLAYAVGKAALLQ